MASSDKPPIDEQLSQLLDAWSTYAVEPLRWQELIHQLVEHSDELAKMDPSRFLAAFSKAEALSWRLRPDLSAHPDGFAYLLLSRSDQILAHSDDDALLTTYIDLDESPPPQAQVATPFAAPPANRLTFKHTNSKVQWNDVKNRVGPAHGHVLLELTASDGEHKRYCYVVPADEFPRSLKALNVSAHCAILVPDTASSPRLARTLQSSFALSEAEVALTLGLVAGNTLKDVAEQQNIVVNTARNQLQSVFAKTGLSRQSELILVVAQLGVIVATADPDEPQRLETDVPERQFLGLPDGTQISYRTYGDTAGTPLLLLHETYGTSRLPVYIQELALKHRLWIVVPDRPGTGFSSAPAEMKFTTIAATLVQFADQFDVEQWTLCGNITGVAYALEMAKIMLNRSPTSIRELFLIAGRAPIPSSLHSNERQWLPDLRRHLVNHPWLLGSFFNILRNRSSENLLRSVMQRVYGSVAHDRELMESQPEVLNHLVESSLEAQCVAAVFVVADLKAYANGSDLNPGELTCPITIWHGELDVVSPLHQLRAYFAGCDVQWHSLPDHGSLVLLQEAEEIFAQVARGSRK